jgi:hypothetical protein
MRPLYEIAEEIGLDWKRVHPSAQPYFNALFDLAGLDDKYFMDDGRTVVLYFLANASTWRGPTARRIKEELNAMLRENRGQRNLRVVAQNPSN